MFVSMFLSANVSRPLVSVMDVSSSLSLNSQRTVRFYLSMGLADTWKLPRPSKDPDGWIFVSILFIFLLDCGSRALSLKKKWTFYEFALFVICLTELHLYCWKWKCRNWRMKRMKMSRMKNIHRRRKKPMRTQTKMIRTDGITASQSSYRRVLMMQLR